MPLKPVAFVLLAILVFLGTAAYGQTAALTGFVYSPDRQPLAAASVGVAGTGLGALTNEVGRFYLSVPTGKDIVLIIKYIGYENKSITLHLDKGQTRNLEVVLAPDTTALNTVTVTGRDPGGIRQQISITRLDPRLTREIPTVFNDFNKILATLPGVVSNNELSSTYSVRGGNYDENLVYVNGMEVYRPFLVTNAQQEGLSFINPDLVHNIEFSSGGWQPKYGDKLSSVLNIEYKKPEKMAGSVTAGLLGGGLHLEGASADKRFTYLVGTRYKNAQLLFNKALETSGNYQPKFGDLQTYLTYSLNKKHPGKTRLGLLAAVARNKYLVIPSNRETTFGTFNQFLRLQIYYDGRERMEYHALQGGINLQHQFNPQLAGEFIVSGLDSREGEFRTLEGAYLLSDIETDPGSPDFNKAVRQRDAGSSFDFSRNTLLARILAVETRFTWDLDPKNQFRWGFKGSRENISDHLHEWGFRDSADFVTPTYLLKTDLQLQSNRISGFVQHSHSFREGQTLTYGLRASHWDYNQQTTVSPRLQYAFTAPGNRNLTFKAAAGLYHQPPFYRELRDKLGVLHPEVKAQRSLHLIAGKEYRFKAWQRDFKWVSEAYYKHLSQVIPYEVDNVRLRYFARNNATAYAYGFDTRINGEFIKGAESWFSLGVLSTKENITGDSLTLRAPGTGDILGRAPIGYIRRPTDQRVNLGIFFQDHIPNDPSLKMYLNLVFGTGLPFGVPGNEGLRNRFTMPNYKRVDIGFSKLITWNDASSNNIGLESLWLSLEVLNLIDANNVVSYNYVQDVNLTTYAVPNYLSSRLINLRFIARF
jgi:hypothetical protein